MVRTLVKTGIADVLSWMGADVAVRGKNNYAIVGYHRVVEDFVTSVSTSIPSMLVSRRMLEQHLDAIGQRFRFVSLDELGTRLASGEKFHHPVAALTFDDGYRDFYENAFPILKRKGIPAAVFVVTGLVGTRAPQNHDRLYFLLSRFFKESRSKASDLTRLLRELGILDPPPKATNAFRATRFLIESLPIGDIERILNALEAKVRVSDAVWEPLRALTWEMLAEMSKAGITVGSHTQSHIMMTNETRPRIMKEVVASRRDVQRHLGVTVRHFAYPSGHFDSDSVQAVAAAGYQFGYTTCTHSDPRYPLLTLPRQLFWEASSLDARGSFSATILECQVRHLFDFANPCRQRHNRFHGGVS